MKAIIVPHLIEAEKKEASAVLSQARTSKIREYLFLNNRVKIRVIKTAVFGNKKGCTEKVAAAEYNKQHI